jgi:hypothetical protein
MISRPTLTLDGKSFVAEFSSENESSYFGGELALCGHKELHLHRLLTIEFNSIVIPFIYGFTYSGCRLTYKVLNPSEIEILEMSPDTVSEDWPYPLYPGTLPKKCLRFRDTDEPLAAIQGIENPDSKGILIIPPSQEYGVSLWGEMGDAEELQVIFEFDLETRIVTCYNQCS